jgi:hypothetical protein
MCVSRPAKRLRLDNVPKIVLIYIVNQNFTGTFKSRVMFPDGE